MPEKFYITTAIPYVNAAPHLGHSLEYVQTDVVARWRRQTGRDVFFLTGADENSLKNVRAAEAEGISTRELVDRNTDRFVDMCRVLEISNDDFIRTVETKHFEGVQKLWSACRPDDIYKKKYQGLYCVGCEAFYTEDELVDGKCPEHQVAPELIEEENYFFRLSRYQAQLEELIATDQFRIVPSFRKNEVLSFIRMGLKDFSVSRSKERAKGWGIPVPGDPDQVIYVWYDALGNYVTGLDYAASGAGTDAANRYTRYWPADVHVIGKGIIRFHAVYWPAMLLSAGVPLPRGLFVHGYVNIGGAKMSKSLGTVVDPFEMVAKYGVEPLRYYLTRYIHPVQDSDFSIESLEKAYTADLANGIGNLLSRSLALIEKNMAATVNLPSGTEVDPIRAKFEEVVQVYEAAMEGFEFNAALAKVWEGLATLDRFINDKAPWSLAKDPARRGELETVLNIVAEGSRIIAALICPVMPSTAAEIWRRLGIEQEIMALPREAQTGWGAIPGPRTVTKGAPLFPRLEEPPKA